ncbi:YijD family membrane protein [Vibrio sp. SCSIO 43136]|uniref:YijD family membrane protein n=1 Tax=Vibrio sp. SCSIO 43136 TaxID=2819101 RepID=UPI0020751882|nr:YijD family membrane protein [Vibrio sp. SCSIO 43136]USD65407.1 YijD family membrane protein [Vibrio sp. SCSIO 43136]
MTTETQTPDKAAEKKTLLLALIAGMCGNALLAGLTMEAVSFSIFPLIALVLAVQNLYQEYLRKPVAEDIPMVGLACFFVGAFGYSAFMGAQHPEVGSNFFAIMVTLLLLAWVGKKLGYVAKPQ